MQWLRQSTAAQVISLGYYLDSTDGDTEETGLTIANTDIKIRKGGATALVSKNSGGATHMESGIYYATLDATDSNTLGQLEIYVHVAGALVTKNIYMVLPAATYDALVTNGLNDIAATDIVSGGAIDTTGGAIDTVTTNIDMVGTDGAALAVDLATVDTNVDAILLDTAEIGTAGIGLTNLGGMSTGMQAQVNTQCDLSLTDYDGPTNAEMEARTLLAADYFDAAADQVIVATNNDKTGYSLSQAFPTNFADMTIEAGTGIVDSMVQGFVGTLITGETTPGNIATNFRVFYDNADAITTQTVDDVGGGGGGDFWSIAEQNEIRGRLGITGTTAAGGNTPTLSTQASIDALNDFDPATDTVVNVTNVAVNADMRGTDDAATAIALAQVDFNVDAILLDTAEIGTAGVGLTNLGGMSTGMKAEVKAECDTSLTDYDPPTNAEMSARTLPSADYFNNTTDQVIVATNNDKTGYSLTQTFPTNFDTMVISGSGAVDSLVQGYLNSLITESSAGRISGNFDVFYDNGNAQTTKLVDDVGTGGGGGGDTDWTASERNEIRGRLGITGTTSAGGNTPTLATAADLATVDTNVDTIAVDTGTDIPAQIAALNNFDPATDTVVTVTNVTNDVGITQAAADQVWTTTVRALTDKDGFTISGTIQTLDGLNNFDPAADPVANVTLVATTTTNTDMRGTDDALLNASYTAPDNAGITANGVAIGNLNDISTGDVNAEMLDVLTVDTFAEPSGVPAATASIVDKLNWIQFKTRNEMNQTNTTQTYRNDTDTLDISTATVSDNGTTFTKGKDT